MTGELWGRRPGVGQTVGWFEEFGTGYEGVEDITDIYIPFVDVPSGKRHRVSAHSTGSKRNRRSRDSTGSTASEAPQGKVYRRGHYLSGAQLFWLVVMCFGSVPVLSALLFIFYVWIAAQVGVCR